MLKKCLSLLLQLSAIRIYRCYYDHFPSVLSIIALVALLFASCENDLKKVEMVASQKKTIVETGKNVEIRYSSAGNVEVKVIAPSFKRHSTEKPYIEFDKGVRVYFYNDQRKVDSKLSAQYGIASQDRDQMIVQDSVVLINTKGEKLNTEELIWKRNQHKIFTDKFVKITRKDEIIMGEGLVSNEEFTRYTIKDIQGTINIESDEFE